MEYASTFDAPGIDFPSQNPNGIPQQSPWLRQRALPWVTTSQNFPTPTGLRKNDHFVTHRTIDPRKNALPILFFKEFGTAWKRLIRRKFYLILHFLPMHVKNKQNRSPLTATFTSMAAAALMVSGCDQTTSKSNNSPDAPVTASSATNAVQKKIAAIVQEQFGWKEEITPNLRIVEDLKGDSLDAVELVMAIEEEFHIEIADEAAEKMRTVGDVVSYVEKAADSKRQ